MDSIFLHELRAETLIGVYEWERRVPQTVQLDLEVALPSSKACQSDRIEDALDYALIVQRVQDALANRHFNLLERLAEHVAQVIMQDFGAPWVRVSVAKLGVLPGLRRLGVTLERGQRPS